MRVLVAGASARALAEAVARAGLEPVAVDAFGDLDLRAACRAVAVARPWRPAAIRAAARSLGYDAFIYTGGLENHPALVGALARGAELWGNPPAVLRRVRDWPRVAARLAAAGHRAPAGLPAGSRAPGGGRWLLKPLRGAGGRGIRLAAPGEAAPPGWRLEQFVRGRPGSALFAAAAGRGARLLAVTEQLIGQPELGAGGFAWCGNILAPDPPPALWSELEAMAALLARELGLRGLGGIDFILQRGRPVALEVNPRWTAAMELLDPAGLVAVHRAALAGELPPAGGPASGAGGLRTGELAGGAGGLRADGPAGGADGLPPGAAAVRGKAVVYTAAPATWRYAGDREQDGLRDVPPPGARLGPGPVCTVLAAGPDRAACRRRLLARARWVRRECIEVAAAIERGALIGAGRGP